MAEALNTFTEGMIMDVHPLMTPNNMLTNVLNGTVITFNGNEFMLLNDMGNGRVETAYLPAGYVPVGVKEYGGIIYIASYNPIKNQSQIGCFPSPERLISSDEMEIPNLKLEDSIFGIEDTAAYRETGATSEYQKLEIFDKDLIFNPGDQFMIAIKDNTADSLEVLAKLITNYLSEGFKNVTIHLALIDESGNITYIENDLLTQDNDYWMPYYENDIPTTPQNPDEYRASIGNKDKYNIYKNKISGRLYLIVELEGIENFDFTRRVNSITELDPNTGEVNENFQVTFNGSALKYTLPDSADLKGYKFDYELYESDDDGNYTLTNLDSVIINSERLPLNPQVGDIVKIENKMSTDANFNKNNLLKYTATPYTDFLFLDRYRKSGLINFAHVNSGVHTLTEWRYYVDNNTISLSYGFDYNPLEGVNARKVYFEFYDVSGDFSVYYKARTRDNWSGNFTDVISFNDVDPIISTPDIRNYTGFGNDSGNNPIIQLPANNKYYSEPQGVNLNDPNGWEPIETLKRNNLYLVRICIEEDINDSEIAGQTKYRETEFFRFLYTTTIFNENYINDFDTILDFSVIQPNYYAQITVNKSNESTFLSNVVTNGNFFSLKNPPSDGFLVTNITGSIRANATLNLTSVLIDANKYFGNYLNDLFNTGFTPQLFLGATITDPETGTYLQDGFASEEMIDKINATTSELASGIYSSIPVSGNNKQSTFSLNGTIGRRILADTKTMTLDYEGRTLLQLFKDEYFTSEGYNKIEVEKRIASLGQMGSGSNREFHFMGNALGMSRDWSGLVTWELYGKDKDVQRRTTGHLDDDHFLRMLKEFVDEEVFSNPVIIPVCGTKGDYASYRLSAGRENTSAWLYANGNELDGGANFLLVAWQAAPSANISAGLYILINMGTKHGNYYDSWDHFGRKPLGQCLAKMLSKFYLVLYDDFSETIYIANNIIYNTQFNTTYSSKININPVSGTLSSMFKFDTINDGEQDFTKSNILTYLNNKIKPNTITNLSYNNIPNDINLNLNQDLFITNEVATEVNLDYEFGRTIRSADRLDQFKNPLNSVQSELENRIYDEEGSSTDALNSAYSIDNVYIKDPWVKTVSANPQTGGKRLTGYYSINNFGPDGTGGFAFDDSEIMGSGGYYYIGGTPDSGRFKTSYSLYGERKGVLNIPLVNTDGVRISCYWVKKKDHPAPDFHKNLIMNSTYAVSKTDSAYDAKHGNDRNSY